MQPITLSASCTLTHQLLLGNGDLGFCDSFCNCLSIPDPPNRLRGRCCKLDILLCLLHRGRALLNVTGELCVQLCDILGLASKVKGSGETGTVQIRHMQDYDNSIVVMQG